MRKAKLIWFLLGISMGVVGVVFAAVAFLIAEDSLDDWGERAVRRGEADGLLEAQADIARGKIVVGRGLASWLSCESVPLGYDLEHDLEADPERAYSCTVNAWRNCVLAQALADRYHLALPFPPTDVIGTERDQASLSAYHREMDRVARERFGAGIDSVQQEILDGRLDDVGCAADRATMERVGALVSGRARTP